MQSLRPVRRVAELGSSSEAPTPTAPWTARSGDWPVPSKTTLASITKDTGRSWSCFGGLGSADSPRARFHGPQPEKCLARRVSLRTLGTHVQLLRASAAPALGQIHPVLLVFERRCGRVERRAAKDTARRLHGDRHSHRRAFSPRSRRGCSNAVKGVSRRPTHRMLFVGAAGVRPRHGRSIHTGRHVGVHAVRSE